MDIENLKKMVTERIYKINKKYGVLNNDSNVLQLINLTISDIIYFKYYIKSLIKQPDYIKKKILLIISNFIIVEIYKYINCITMLKINSLPEYNNLIIKFNKFIQMCKYCINYNHLNMITLINKEINFLKSSKNENIIKWKKEIICVKYKFYNDILNNEWDLLNNEINICEPCIKYKNKINEADFMYIKKHDNLKINFCTECLDEYKTNEIMYFYSYDSIENFHLFNIDSFIKIIKHI